MIKKITREMTLGEIVMKHPEAVEIMLNYGLHCVGCHVANWETIEQGAMAHGMNEKEIEEMIQKLNKIINKE